MKVIVENIHGEILEINAASEIKRDGNAVYIYHQLKGSRFKTVRVLPVFAVKKIAVELPE